MCYRPVFICSKSVFCQKPEQILIVFGIQAALSYIVLEGIWVLQNEDTSAWNFVTTLTIANFPVVTSAVSSTEA